MAKSKMESMRFALDFVTEGVAGAQPEVLGMAPRKPKIESWTKAENIQGFGIAERITKGKKLSDLALKVYVERKLPKAKVESPVPEKVKLPGVDEPVYTDVEEIGKVALEANTARHRPAMPGCGLGHFDVTVGTFGCLVRKKGQPGKLYVLSNSHVLANEGLGQAGDIILQAGAFDGGLKPDDVIGELAEFVPFEFTDDGFPNLVDAAIAAVKKPAEVTSVVSLIGVPKGISTVVRRGMKVRKCGRTTDLTMGEIKDVDYRLPVNYKKSADGTTGRAGMRDQVLCTRFTAGGDSGSAVFNMDGKIVGLHFAGTPSTSIFNRIGNVLDALDLEIVTEEI